MPEHATRDQAGLYDHESAKLPRRRPRRRLGHRRELPARPRAPLRAARWPVRDARASEGPARSRRRPVEDWGADEALRRPRRRSPEPEAAAARRADRASRPPRTRRRRRDRRHAGAARGRARRPPHDPHQRPPRRGVGDRAVHRPRPAAGARRAPSRSASAGDPTRIIAWAFAARAAADPDRDRLVPPSEARGRLRSQAPRLVHLLRVRTPNERSICSPSPRRSP